MTNKRNRKQKKVNKQDRIRTDRGILNRTWVVMILCGICAFIPVVGMLANLMVVRHEEYAERALRNQTRTTYVTAARGSIYDCNMNVMAVSATVQTVFLDPWQLDQRKEKQDNELVFRTLANLLDLDVNWVRAQAADTSMYYKVLATKQTSDITDQIRKFINDNHIIGVHMEPDYLRVYPYTTLAAQVLGFVRNDGNGAEGLEAYYNRYLQGTEGKVITTKGNYNTEIPYSYEKYYEASDGNSLVLTLDATVQYYLEKNLQAAVEKYAVQNGAFGIVMNVKTGEVLAMTTLDSYDPNNFLEIYSPKVKQQLTELQSKYLIQMEGSKAYEEAKDAYDEALVEARRAQWRNRVVSDGYEPGSTFKIITMAAALEEGTVKVDDNFYCGGAEWFAGRPSALHCWKHEGHGAENTFQALQNSCNLALAHIGLDLGGAKFYQYCKAFGLLDSTDVGLAGEGSGFFFSEDMLDDPDSNGYVAAVIAGSFGQTFKVTPMQLVTALSAVVNGGNLMEPYIVSQILDPEGNVVMKNEPTVSRQVISKETSDIMRAMIQSVVEEGTAGNAAIAGYAIGGKTGTAEKTDVYDEEGNHVEDKIVSFVGMAPMDDPQYIVLVALDTPSPETKTYISGGVMAAPTVRGVFEDILPYLGVARDLTGVDMGSVEVEMPALKDLTEEEAVAELAKSSLTCRVVGRGKTVTAQIPAPGAKLPGLSEVIIYKGQEAPQELVEVPDFTGMTIGQASRTAQERGLYVLVKGASYDSGYVTASGQDIKPLVMVAPGTTIKVDFTDTSALD